MARSILEILLRTKGGKQTKEDVEGVGKATTGLGGAFKSAGGALIGIGLAVGIADYGREAFLAAAEGRAMTAALTASLGPTENYADAIAQAKIETRGMINEATLAGTITAQLAGGLANNAEEAAKLTRAGGILSTVFAASGASMESFNRLLSTGSAQLVDNFNLTLGQVNARKALIETSTDLEGQEAKLQAIKELLIESSVKYESSISAEQEALAQSKAAWIDLKGAVGEFIAGPGTDLLNWGAESTKEVQRRVEILQGLGGQLDTIREKRGFEAQRQQLEKLNLELGTLQGIVDDFGAESPADVLAGDLAVIAALEAQIAEIEESLEGARRATVRLDSAVVESGLPEYQQQVFQAARAVDMLAQAEREAAQAVAQSRSAQAARMTGLAAQFGVEAAQVDPISQRQMLTDFFAVREEGEEDVADAAIRAQERAVSEAAQLWNSNKGVIASVLSEGFSVLDDLTLPFLSQDTGRDIGENARRLAAVAMGDFSGEAAKLLEQEKPELFAKLMASGDPAAMAQDILKDFQSGVDQFGLIDEATALERARKIIFGNISKEEMAARLTEQLTGEGFGQKQISAALGEAGFAAGGNEAAIEGGTTGFGDFEAGLLLAAEEGETMSKLGRILGEQVKDNPDWLEAGLAAGRAFEGAFFQTFEAGGWGGRMISKIITDVVAQIGLPHPMEGRGTP